MNPLDNSAPIHHPATVCPQSHERNEALQAGVDAFHQGHQLLVSSLTETNPAKKTQMWEEAHQYSIVALENGCRVPVVYMQAGNAAHHLSNKAHGEVKLAWLDLVIDYSTKALEPCPVDSQDAQKLFQELKEQERSLIYASLGFAQFNLSQLQKQEEEKLLNAAEKNVLASFKFASEIHPIYHSLLGDIYYHLFKLAFSPENKQMLVKAQNHYILSLHFGFTKATDYLHLGSVLRQLAKYEETPAKQQMYLTDALNYLGLGLTHYTEQTSKACYHLLMALLMIENNKQALLNPHCQQHILDALNLGPGKLVLWDELGMTISHLFCEEPSFLTERTLGLLKLIYNHIIRHGNIEDEEEQVLIAQARANLFGFRCPFREIVARIEHFNKKRKEGMELTGVLKVTKTNTPFFMHFQIESPELLEKLRKKIDELRILAGQENPGPQVVAQLGINLWLLAKSSHFEEREVMLECYNWLKQSKDEKAIGLLGTICARLARKKPKEKERYLTEAEEYLQKAIAFGKNNSDLYRELGKVFWSKCKDGESDPKLLAKALQAYTKALVLKRQQDPDNFLEPEIYAELGDVQRLLAFLAETVPQKMELYTQAKFHLEMALDRGSDRQKAIFARLSQIDKFLKAYSKPF